MGVKLIAVIEQGQQLPQDKFGLWHWVHADIVTLMARTKALPCYWTEGFRRVC